MTLILTAAGPDYVVQLSDRLVTAGKHRHDVMSNKTVVYRAKDALVSIGYSGIAYVGDVPTDEWIAGVLWGEPAPRGRDGVRPAISMGAAPIIRDIGQAVIRLEREITALPPGALDTYGLYLTIAGWREERRGPRSFVVEIERRGGATTVTRSPRRPSKGQELRFHSIGAPVSATALRAHFAPFRRERVLICNIQDVETHFAEMIRETALHAPGVGANVMSVLLPRPDLGPAVCRFVPNEPHAVRIGAPQETSVVEVAHSPWIIGPTILYPPAFAVGRMQMDLGGLHLVVVGAAPTSGLLGLSSSIRRPPPPSRR